jgi:YD repeat-containing protein
VGLDSQQSLVIVDSGHNKIRRVVFQNTVNSLITFAPVNPDLSKITKNNDGTFTRTYRNGTKIYFDQNGNEYALVDRVGRQTTFLYDANGNLTQVKDPTNQTMTYQYGGGNKLNSITDSAGRTTSFEYSGDLLTRVQFPDGSAKSYAYDATGLMTSEVDERGGITKYTYNQWNRLQAVTRADNTNVIVNDVGSLTAGNNFTGGNFGQLKTLSTTPGQAYDGIKDPKSIETKFSKDYRGYITQIVDAQSNTTSILRNDIGQPKEIIRPDTTKVNFTYERKVLT